MLSSAPVLVLLSSLFTLAAASPTVIQARQADAPPSTVVANTAVVELIDPAGLVLKTTVPLTNVTVPLDQPFAAKNMNAASTESVTCLFRGVNNELHNLFTVQPPGGGTVDERAPLIASIACMPGCWVVFP